jgi:hypothetical protein
VSQADELARLGLATEAELPLAADEEARVFAALEAALRPSELSAEVNERLLELALEDPLAPPTDEELVESARLRDALAQGSPHEDADVLRALRASFAPQVNEDETANEQALASALGSARAGKQARGTAPRSRGKLIFAAFGAASAVLAAAAAALLFVTASRSEAPPSAASEPTAALVRPHSTAPLFPDRFDNDTTARMDLIASVRSRDLRDNRYTSWGVR